MKNNHYIIEYNASSHLLTMYII